MPTLDWIGKDKVINHHLDVPYRVLERVYSYDEKGLHDEDNDSENMIIHGDNLSALKSLLPQYEGKVKCIYIDPPYNTGNENWVYNDNVNDPRIKKWLGEVVGKEGEDLSRHDKWLCMMYPRLKLLQKLLADDGVIFISIDDVENTNLKMICDEIFGSNSFISNISWQRTYSMRNDVKGLYVDGEVGNSTIKKLFSAGSVNNKAQVNFDGLNRINVFRTKHNLVCDALISRLSITPGDMLKEAFIIGAGLKGNGGRADVVRNTPPLSSVWEVKPDSAYGRLTGAPQVATYVNRSNDQINKDTYKAYCPLTYGSNITPFYMPWDGSRQVYVSSYRTDGVNNPGVVYYRDTKGTEPIWQPSPVLLPAPKPNEDYKTITLPEPQTVYNGLLTIGVAITAVVIIKGAIAFAASLPTGGLSLTLLFI